MVSRLRLQLFGIQGSELHAVQCYAVRVTRLCNCVHCTTMQLCSIVCNCVGRTAQQCETNWSLAPSFPHRFTGFLGSPSLVSPSWPSISQWVEFVSARGQHLWWYYGNLWEEDRIRLLNRNRDIRYPKVIQLEVWCTAAKKSFCWTGYYLSCKSLYLTFLLMMIFRACSVYMSYDLRAAQIRAYAAGGVAAKNGTFWTGYHPIKVFNILLLVILSII